MASIRRLKNLMKAEKYDDDDKFKKSALSEILQVLKDNEIDVINVELKYLPFARKSKDYGHIIILLDRTFLMRYEINELYEYAGIPDDDMVIKAVDYHRSVYVKTSRIAIVIG